MSWRGAVIKKALMWGLPIVGLLAAKTKVSSGPTHDPDQPRARDGAPRPSGDKDFQDARFACESLVPGSCDASDVADWVWTYYTRGLLPMTKVAEELQAYNPDNTEAAQLIAQATARWQAFYQEYPGWTPPPAPDKPTTPVAVAAGNEMVAIQQINSQIDVAIALRKEMVALFTKLNPGVIPQGATPIDIAQQKEDEQVGAGTYAAAGAVVGLGIALAFVVATNKKKQRPRY